MDEVLVSEEAVLLLCTRRGNRLIHPKKLLILHSMCSGRYGDNTALEMKFFTINVKTIIYLSFAL